jgi:glycopeptide antibiotics resistance protein
VRARRTATIALIANTALLLILTIGPIPQTLVGSEAELGVLSWGSWLEASTWRSGRRFEFVANVLVFVPWGVLALIAVGARRWGFAVVGGVVLTLAIEITQIPLPRISDPRDLVANTVGTVIGIIAAMAIVGVRRDTVELPTPSLPAKS